MRRSPCPKSACGHDCEECAGCGVSGVSVYAKALNTVGAQRDRRWWWRATRKKMLKIVSFVYLIPVVLFLAGYLITLALTPSVAVQYTVAVAGAVWVFCWPCGMIAGVKAGAVYPLPSCGYFNVRVCKAAGECAAAGGTGTVRRMYCGLCPLPSPAVRAGGPVHPEL